MDDRRPLSDTERADWLQLARTDTIGPIRFRQLIDRFGDAADAIAALPDMSKKKITVPGRNGIEAELNATAAAGGRAIALCEPDYPERLAAIDDPPPMLFVRGDLELLSRPAVAIVGARNASANGKRTAAEIAADLGDAGFVVVSGLARGIDGSAHEGALATGTVAAVAGGIDVVYPPEHAELSAQIAATGALVSEQPMGTKPTARHFPARNRLISGLAAGVLVVEAARKSGSLITARLALEQGREVFAIPGSPRDPRCQGTNHLIREGAFLTECAADIVETLQLQIPPRMEKQARFETSQPVEKVKVSDPGNPHEKILALLGATPTGVDELVRECHMSAASIQSALLELELDGRIERHPGNRVSLVL